jgi:hypothetical protein
MKLRKGNKQNSFLNGEYVAHARRWLKKLTNKIRRNKLKNEFRHNNVQGSGL